MSSQECKVRPSMGNINSDESLFYPYSALVNKYNNNCNDFNNQYAKSCVADVIKEMNIKVFISNLGMRLVEIMINADVNVKN